MRSTAADPSGPVWTEFLGEVSTMDLLASSKYDMHWSANGLYNILEASGIPQTLPETSLETFTEAFPVTVPETRSFL